jgi:ligand-binding sensor domain-containing protein/signal transduction histidine kinase
MNQLTDRMLKDIKIFSIALLIIFIRSGSLIGQQVIFNKVVPEDGERLEMVSGITQDFNGLMWFATQAGLYSYDGDQFKSIKNDPFDPNSLASDRLESICFDSSGFIWLGTRGAGLERFDPVTGLIRHYNKDPDNPRSLPGNYINALLADQDGTIWIGTAEGLGRYDKPTDSFVQYRNVPGDTTSLSYDEVMCLYEDRQGTIWVGTASVYGDAKNFPELGGLNKLDKTTGKFTRFKHDETRDNSLINNKIRALLEDSKGTFWVGTAGDGLHSMDREKGTFTRYRHDPDHPEKLSRPPISREYPATDHITFIREDATGALWIGTSESGINYYNPATGKTTHFEENDDTKGAFPDRSVWSSFISRDGILWISTLEGNLYRVDPFRRLIPHYPIPEAPVLEFYMEQNGTLWIGTDNGLIRNDFNKGETRHYLFEKDDSNSNLNSVSIIKEDRHGNILVGSNAGFYIWDKEKQIFNNYVAHSIITSGYDVQNIYTIFEDRGSNLWVGKSSGFDIINPDTGFVGHYKIYPEDTISFGRNFITTILQDKTNNIWIGAWFGGGLHLFNKKDKTFKSYLQEVSVIAVYEDMNGVLWAGTNKGLYSYDIGSESFLLFKTPNRKHGITYIRSILEDDQENLWLSTSSGIIKINPERNDYIIYGEKFGLDGTRLAYNSSYTDRQGMLYFGDETGYYAFNPDEITTHLRPPEIAITMFRIADEEIKPGNESPIGSSLSQTKEIRLTYKQNNISFDFTAIDYSDPEENRLLFMLENYDKTWHHANQEKRAVFFNIPPGKYVFRIKASNIYGVWAEKSVNIIIMAPWWESWWAYVIYGILFILGVFIVDRIQRKRVIAKERYLAKEKELLHAKEIEKAYKELKATQTQLIHSEKMASLGELTAGIAHEIQNPLNFVNNFSEVSTEMVDEMKQELAVGSTQLAEEIAEEIKQNLQKILHHGKRADGIVKGMLQHSRSSSGQKELTDINALADEYLRLAYHGLRAKDKSFNATMKTNFDKSIGKINIIPQDIGRVILNLITNAFFAVNEKKQHLEKDLSAFSNLTGQKQYDPTVTVSTSKAGNKVLISVYDNGNGIPEEIKNKIFQPFFTTKPTGQGTGLGLSLSYDIITNGHGGELFFETKENEGTIFFIKIPC